MSEQIAVSLEDLRAAADAAGYALVPKEPSPGLLMSMALRADHGLGCPGYYDEFKFGGVGHAQRLEAAIRHARQAHEEVVGAGFWSPEREAMYVKMQADACKAAKP